MGDALATYGSALLILALSSGLGFGIQAACGGRRCSLASPAIGFAAALILAWWTVRLPGEGVTALAVLAVLAIIGAMLGSRRLSGFKEIAGPAALTVIGGFVIASIPFIVEGHFGILGTGFNVDMSQHLFAASRLAEPAGAGSGLLEQGYPLGPHALAVVAEAVSGNLALSFTGLTLLLPALAALAVCDCFGARDRRSIGAALLTAFAYLAASWYAQGSFKELAEAVLLVALVAWLRSLVTSPAEAWARRGPLLAIPAALVAAASLYAYSAPGLAWLGGTIGIWVVLELLTDRERAIAIARRLLVPTVVGIVVLLAVAAPELPRVVDFSSSVDAVADRGAAATPPLVGEAIAADPSGAGDRTGRGDLDGVDNLDGVGEREGAGRASFNDDLGNLFGWIDPLQVFGVWPSGDFRVLPGDGTVPAPIFWLGALLGISALALGVRRVSRAGDSVLAAALLAAASIWLAARIGSTPYTAAKALMVLSVPVMLVSLIGALAALSRRGAGARRTRRVSLKAALASCFVAAAVLSSGLALANAPVGPSEYSPAVRSLAPRFEGVPTQLLAPVGVLADRHGRDFYGWELRGARRTCVDAIPAEGGSDPPPGIRLVLVVGDSRQPYEGLRRHGSRGNVVLWRVADPGRLDRLRVDAENPTVCTAR